MIMWRCTVCGYVHEGEEAPENCLRCGAPKNKFQQLQEEEVALLLKARRTNDILARLNTLAREIEDLATEGVKINLDPTCLTIFTATQKKAVEVRQMARGEIDGHVKKMKWG